MGISLNGAGSQSTDGWMDGWMDGWIDRSLTSDVEGKASEPASLFGRVSVTPRSPHSHSLTHASVPSLRERGPSTEVEDR